MDLQADKDERIFERVYREWHFARVAAVRAKARAEEVELWVTAANSEVVAWSEARDALGITESQPPSESSGNGSSSSTPNT